MILQIIKHKLSKQSIIGVTLTFLTSCGSTSNHTYYDGIYNDEPVIEVTDNKKHTPETKDKKEQEKQESESNTFTTELERLNQLNGTTKQIDTSIRNINDVDQFNYKKATESNISDVNINVYTNPDWRWRSSTSLYGRNGWIHFHNWNYDNWYWNNTYWYPNYWNRNYYYTYDFHPYWNVRRNNFWYFDDYYYPRSRWGYRGRFGRTYINNNRRRETNRYSRNYNNTHRTTRNRSRVRESNQRTYSRNSSNQRRTSRTSRTSRRNRNFSKRTTRDFKYNNNSSNNKRSSRTSRRNYSRD